MHETDKRSSPSRRPVPGDEIWVCHLDTIPYRRAMELQLSIRARRLAGELPDMLLLLEHPPVYTRGRRSAPGELALGEDFYRARGIEVAQTDRGGRVTYHGPGQLVGYPIMRVTDIGAHLRTMESAIVAALGDFGVEARSRCAEGPDYTGVWVTTAQDMTRDKTRHGPRARSPRSACTSRAGSPPMASRSTSTTTWRHSRGSSPAGCPTSR